MKKRFLSQKVSPAHLMMGNSSTHSLPPWKQPSPFTSTDNHTHIFKGGDNQKIRISLWNTKNDKSNHIKTDSFSLDNQYNTAAIEMANLNRYPLIAMTTPTPTPTPIQTPTPTSTHPDHSHQKNKDHRNQERRKIGAYDLQNNTLPQNRFLDRKPIGGAENSLIHRNGTANRNWDVP